MAPAIRAQLQESQRVLQEKAERARERQQQEQEKEKERKREMEEQRRAAAARLQLGCAESLSPATEGTGLARASKRPRFTPPPAPVVPTEARPVWKWWDDKAWSDSFVELALAEGPPEPLLVDQTLVTDAFKNGQLLARVGGKFVTSDGADSCPYWSSQPWWELASKITVTKKTVALGSAKKVEVVETGDTGLKKLGCGTFNIVYKVEPGHGIPPPWLMQVAADAAGRTIGISDVCIRLTRPDVENSEHKYQSASMIAQEAKNAMYAALNGIGVNIYSICGYSGIRPGRTMRYGAAYVMQKATQDLWRMLDSIADPAKGTEIAIKCVELIYVMSRRCGVAFFDIKPNNLLEVATPNGGYEIKLTDYDSAFFLVDMDKDWRALMLLNLALLAAHVRNMDNGAVSNAFLKAVKPTLMQLINRRSDYESGWLFEVRSLEVDFAVPANTSDFELQRMFCVIGASYFYGEALGKLDVPPLSSKWRWEKRDQKALEDHWRVPLNRKSWPTYWPPGFRPLIDQLVAFAVGHV